MGVHNNSLLRRSLAAQSSEDTHVGLAHLIPVAQSATENDVAILWQSHLEPAVNNYYSCLGKVLTSKVSSSHGAQQWDMSDDTIAIDADWMTSMASMALDEESATSLIKEGAVKDLMVLTDRPLEVAKDLLSDRQRGRMIGLFEHPVETMWESLRKVKGGGYEGYKEEWREMGVIEWIASIKDLDLVNNMQESMVKLIVGKNLQEKVTVDDLKAAMDFVTNYVVVGLETEREESLWRFNLAMGMKDKSLECEQVLAKSKESPSTIVQNSPEWLALAALSPLDVMLYRHIERLFEEQYEKFEEFPSEGSTNQDSSAVWWSDEFNSITIKSHLAPYNGPFVVPSGSVPQTPFFWQIPRSGGSHLQNLYWCMDMTLANQVGGEPRFRKTVPRHKLVEFQPWVEHGNEARVINVDLSSRNGIVNAKNLGLLSHHLSEKGAIPKPDIIFSTLFYYVSVILMSRHNRGRLFALFRDPIERAASRFESLKVMNKAWENISIEQWATQEAPGENNWMVRSLVGKGAEDKVYLSDLELAKVVVRSKFIVGLTDRYMESLHRFNVLLNVDENGARAKECLQSHEAAYNSKKPSVQVEKGSPTYVTLKSANFLDVMLYQYIEELFGSQAELFKEAKTE